jgi:tRNA nucleotidyltransferase (CCA-adding enzyme)
MATTLSDGFEIFRSNLEVTDLQSSVLATRQQNVREAVASEFEVLDTFLTGSYRRSTMIAPLAQADVDVFVVLDPQYYRQNTPQSLLERVRERLRATYPKTARR